MEAGKIKVDENKPKTKIRVRLHNNKQVVVEFNTDDKVGRLFVYVAEVAPV